MITALITLLIMMLVLGLIYYALTLFPLPAPFATIAHVILLVIAVIVLIWVLLGFLPDGRVSLLR